MIWPFRKQETRVKSSDPYIAEFFGQRAGIGGHVDPTKASGHAVAHRCISVVAETLSSVPLKLYKRTEDGGREAASDHPLYGVLHDAMNGTLTAFEGRELLIAAVLTMGNGYARVERNGRGQVIAMHPLHDVAVERLASGRLRYRAGSDVLLQEEVLHLRYRTRDGVVGFSPIQIAAATFGLALAQQAEAGAQAVNAFRPAGALVFPESLGGEAKAGLLASFRQKFIGALKANEIMVLDGGVKFESISIPNKDAEFLESRKLSNLDVCRVYGVPPTVAGILDHGTYSNVQEESRALVTRCLAPMARRIEQAMTMALLTTESRKSFFIEHDLAGLLRGDLAGRYSAYRTGREGGWLSANEIRGFENMSKIDGGDTYLEPLNHAPLGSRDAANDNGQPKDIAA